MYENETGEGKTRNRNSLLRFNSVSELGTGYQNGELAYPSFQNKMFIYDEFGHFLSIAKPPNKDSGIDPTTEFNNCADFMFKQDLWFTFAAGCAVAGLDWWNNDQLPRFAMWKKYFGGFLEFTKDLDFENVDYTKVHWVNGKPSIAQRWPTSDAKVTKSNSIPYKKNDRVEAYTQVASNKDQAFGWMVNRTVHWYNLREEYPCLKSLVEGTKPFSIPYLYKPKDDDITEKATDISSREAFFKVRGFKLLKRYEIRYYNTLTGKQIHMTTTWSSLSGKIKCQVPEMKVSENPDVAYKIKRKGIDWK